VKEAGDGRRGVELSLFEVVLSNKTKRREQRAAHNIPVFVWNDSTHPVPHAYDIFLQSSTSL
jgi:hypothetical protein